MVDELRPSLNAFEALDAAGAEVFFVLTGSFWERADPAADLLFEPVSPLLRVFEAAVAALDEVVFPDIAMLHFTTNARCAVSLRVCSPIHRKVFDVDNMYDNVL